MQESIVNEYGCSNESRSEVRLRILPRTPSGLGCGRGCKGLSATSTISLTAVNIANSTKVVKVTIIVKVLKVIKVTIITKSLKVVKLLKVTIIANIVKVVKVVKVAIVAIIVSYFNNCLYYCYNLYILTVYLLSLLAKSILI